MSLLVTIAATLLSLVVFAAVGAAITYGVIRTMYVKVGQSEALIINKVRSTKVSLRGGLVIPGLHKHEVMDIGVKALKVRKDGTDGLICKDNIRADIEVTFYVKIDPGVESIVKVAQLVGCKNASDLVQLNELFSAKFAEALKSAGKQMDFVDLYNQRTEFRKAVVEVIGEDLNGYVLDDVAIEYLEQTPLESMNPDNVLDAEGIRKITQITRAEAVVANEYRREAEKATKAKDVETQQAIFEMNRQEAAAEARADREMATTRAREMATTREVEAQERLRAEAARIATEEQLAIQAENRDREVEVAAKNRERAVAVEAVKVDRARQLEQVAAEVETTAARKDLELERARIAELAKARIAVDRTVAEQEEAIETLRVVEAANREKEALVIAAAGSAEAELVTTIKSAEARQRAAEHAARERMLTAQAAKDAAELEADAAISLAEGTKAQAAAEGLAEVAVRRAEAEAVELRGVADARVKEADAHAELKLGEARAQAKIADAAAQQKLGEAEAETVRLSGAAEASSIEAKLRAEAAGMLDKAGALRELEAVGQEFELTVKRLDADVAVRTAAIEADRDAHIAQATALGEALGKANIDIVGGDNLFVDRMLSATSTARAIDRHATSDTVQGALGSYLTGDKDIVAAVGDAIAGLGAEGIKDLTVAQLLHRLADNGQHNAVSALSQLLGGGTNPAS